MTTQSQRPSDADSGGAASNFIRNIISEDLAAGRHKRVVTRFPPEPNGYLHIGHAKSILLNFGLASEFGGVCHMRFDDTNPAAEDLEYVESIQRDVRWLGGEWGDKLFFASDYFERLYAFAVELIQKGKAYVCSLSEAETRELRGTVTEPGRDSPYRSRSVEENLDLFARMRAGEFPEGAHVLRAKIDMAAPNMKMRDPPIYRIKRARHYRTGDAWCIYPLYDFAHSLSDAIEGITHSICTLEFENNRELYDWIIESLDVPSRPRQYEFARLNLNYTVMSKRKLLGLVKGGVVSGWDDPRMPTIAGLRRRGVTPEAIRAFCEEIGVAKTNSMVDIAKFESCVRDDLNLRAPRVMAVLRPLRVVLENFPEGKVEEIDAPYWPEDVPRQGSRKVPLSRVVYIERDDFLEDPPKKWFRLAPGQQVRLRYAGFITCREVVRDQATGEVIELRCTYDPPAKTGEAPEGRKPKGTLHWVSAAHAIAAEVRLYGRLFAVERPDAVEEGKDFLENLNPGSLVTLTGCRVEPSLSTIEKGSHVQFERQGFFFVDPVDSAPGAPVFNRTVALKDSWSKLAAEKPAQAAAPAPRAPDSAAQRAQPAKPKAERAPLEERLARLEPARAEKARHLIDARGIPGDDAVVLAEDDGLLRLFEEAVAVHDNARSAANWVIHSLSRELKDKKTGDLPFTGAQLGELLALIDDGTISGKIAKDVLAEMMQQGGSPKAIVERRGLRQVADEGALERIVDQVVAAHPGEVSRFRAGNAKLIGFFVGQVMKASGGKANPDLVNALLTRKLA
ncbi:glutamine--tRNA ligase/YqeY domain fusion protein [Sorangium cellulosum]|uniref:Glutamine--tRNA ligase n=1 Tax=Sorangium cellulosum TaxID=56 RepID=A0A150QV01_SORCE|nr:glutamine--tRNA ligase/YqeY domain fusion protein [Sorangium cellulosum]KYF71835.1 glutamine--tRNA ligase [Sorangium cellulosum]